MPLKNYLTYHNACSTVLTDDGIQNQCRMRMGYIKNIKELYTS